MNTILFRCSKLGLLMTQPKSATDKTAGNLSQTAKTAIEEMWLADQFGYQETVVTDVMMKGHLNEQDGFALVQKVLGGEFRRKWPERLQNQFIIGHPDCVLSKEDYVEDIKNSWTIKTFFQADLDTGYWWQGQGYMELTGKKHYRLCYTLTDTPEEIILNLKKKAWYNFNCNDEDEEYQRICQEIDRNHRPSEWLEEKNRLKVLEFDYDPDAISRLYNTILKARQYYASLKLETYVKFNNPL